MRSLVAAIVLSTCSCATVQAEHLSKPVAEYTGPRSIQIEEVDTDPLAPALDKFKERVAAGDDTVYFRINSYGGSIMAGNDFIQAVVDQKKLHGTHTICVVDSRAYSMAFVILQSAACDERWMTDTSTLLAHNGWTKASGGEKELQSEASFLRALNESMAKLCSKRMGMDINIYKQMIDGRDWTMSAPDALFYTAVDKVVDVMDVPPPFELAPKADNFLKQLFGG